jgi:hypothetical protein
MNDALSYRGQIIADKAEAAFKETDGQFDGALRLAVNRQVGHGNWPGDVDPMTIHRWTESTKAVLAQLIENGLHERVGQRVRFTTAVERYPFFTAPEGTTGTIVEWDERHQHGVVRLDTALDGADEWTENGETEVFFDADSFTDSFDEQVEVIADA